MNKSKSFSDNKISHLETPSRWSPCDLHTALHWSVGIKTKYLWMLPEAQKHLPNQIKVSTSIFPLVTFADSSWEIFFSNSTISAMFPGMAGEDRISGMMHEKSAWQLWFPAPKCFAPSAGFPWLGFPPPLCSAEHGRNSLWDILWREEIDLRQSMKRMKMKPLQLGKRCRAGSAEKVPDELKPRTKAHLRGISWLYYTREGRSKN